MDRTQNGNAVKRECGGQSTIWSGFENGKMKVRLKHRSINGLELCGVQA